MSRFEKFFGAATVSGKKVLGSIHPELKAGSTKDKFSLNAVGLKLLGIKPGVDRIMLFDQVADATSLNDRFFICKGGVDKNGVEHGALVGKNGVFSYSSIWSAFHMQDMNIVEAKPEDMVAAGKVQQGTTKDEDGKEVPGSYIALQLVLGKLEIAKDVDEDGNEIEARDQEVEAGLYADVYAVTNFRIVPHDPRSMKDEDEIEETEVDADGNPVETVKAPKAKKAKK